MVEQDRSSTPDDTAAGASAVVHEADIRNGEPDAIVNTDMSDGEDSGEHGSEPLDQDPPPGKLPSDADVQAERQPDGGA
jgi:hypothetical protein